MATTAGAVAAAAAAGFDPGKAPTSVSKLASTLLAKHVRTLEVLHSLQTENAQLRRQLRRQLQVRRLPRAACDTER